MKNKVLKKVKKVRKVNQLWLFFIFSSLLHFLLIFGGIFIPVLNADHNMPSLGWGGHWFPLPEPLPPRAPSNYKERYWIKSNASMKNEIYVKGDLIETILPKEVPEKTLDESLIDLFGFNSVDFVKLVECVPGGVPEGVQYGRILGKRFKGINKRNNSINILWAPKPINTNELVWPRTLYFLYEMGIRKVSNSISVNLEVILDASGKVSKINIIQCHPILRNGIVRTLMDWKFQPCIINRRPRSVKFNVEITFTNRDIKFNFRQVIDTVNDPK